MAFYGLMSARSHCREQRWIFHTGGFRPPCSASPSWLLRPPRSPRTRRNRRPPPGKGARPLKVFILAGQSNMQGHANVSTFDSMADDPKTAPLLKEMRGPDGKPRVCEKVWISSVGCARRCLLGLKRAERQTDGGVRRLDRRDRSGIHVRHLHGEAAGRAHPDHQDLLGRQESAHRFPSAQRRAVRVERLRVDPVQAAGRRRGKEQGRQGRKPRACSTAT